MGSDMGASEFYRRSCELSRELSTERQWSASDEPGRTHSGDAPRRDTPLPDKYEPPRRRNVSQLPTLFDEDDGGIQPDQRGPVISPRARPSSPASRQVPSEISSATSRHSSISLNDVGTPDLEPQHQARVIVRVVRELERSEDWLGMAVYLSVVGQGMTQRVENIQLGRVRQRLCGHVEAALEECGNADDWRDAKIEVGRTPFSGDPATSVPAASRRKGLARRVLRLLRREEGNDGV